MKVTEEFLQAKKDKKLTAFMVVQLRPLSDPLIRLWVDSKYSGGASQPIDCPTEIRLESFGGKEKNIKSISFHESVYPTLRDNHITTFLKAINKNSDVRFRVLAFNSCDAHQNVGFESHQLYGIINERVYFLASYTGPQNTASPVQI